MDFFKKRRVHVKEQAEDEDVVVKTGSYRLYFHNYYTLISLTNDFLIGGLYTAAALIGLFDGPVLIANLCYLGGALFLILRPIIKIFRNIYLYSCCFKAHSAVDTLTTGPFLKCSIPAFRWCFDTFIYSLKVTKKVN